VNVPRRVAYFADGTAPLPARCHTNVDRWVTENLGWKAVRGWGVVSSEAGTANLAAHSVLRSDEGELVDIILTASDPATPFILHVGTEAEFDHLRVPYASLCWPPLPMLDTADASLETAADHSAALW